MHWGSGEANRFPPECRKRAMSSSRTIAYLAIPPRESKDSLNSGASEANAGSLPSDRTTLLYKRERLIQTRPKTEAWRNLHTIIFRPILSDICDLNHWLEVSVILSHCWCCECYTSIGGQLPLFGEFGRHGFLPRFGAMWLCTHIT